MFEEKQLPPDNLDYDLTPRVVLKISDFYQIRAAVGRINTINENPFFEYSVGELLRVLKDCDIKYNRESKYNDKNPTYIHDSWINLVLVHASLAEVTLLQSEVLSKEYFGISPVALKRSRVGRDKPTEKQTAKLQEFITDEHILDIEKERLQAVLDEDSLTKSRASMLIGYFIGDNSKHRFGGSEGVLNKRARELKNKNQNANT
ncbi:MAG: hypothetical protein HOB84_01715 [Candidatus Marinimicrobia bacterium]|jgi:hypothetical protein|nr:hypothetical protein [Candidatus Neomarinimicrobiota bacterium]MBT4360063.1 hypothetical protein [Candidatus Neomarinimicrobiota bacterium]MBT4713471.1 hypothetical protein [Candidatus Neomarinimicrobiota bacterium]MBT4993070.1 hypothetical protein [Candidatus Neomarinimicrobiota bacterium]MBT5270424.1 hypothetical protein [Candidatus Neomarinimicrobiota bacterium]